MHQVKQNQSVKLKISRRLLAGGLVLLWLVLQTVPAAAASANISRSYEASPDIPIGSLVSLDADEPGYVVPATTANAQKLVGIVVNSEDSLLALDADVAKVQVATSGTASMLVSTLGGDIERGDQIAVSPFAGVGMKAGSGSKIIGLAQTPFNADSEEADSQTVTDRDGQQKQIAVGYIDLVIGIGTAPTQSQGNDDANLNSLQKLVKALTGHRVSTWRALIGLLVAFITFAALASLIYGAIFGSIVSIGRNPLAKFAVFRTLSMALGMALLIAAVGLTTIYLLLR